MKTIRNLAGFLALSFLFLLTGCDSGQKAVDEVTGNRAVKQYHKTTQDLEKVAGQQEDRYKSVPEEENR